MSRRKHKPSSQAAAAMPAGDASPEDVALPEATEAALPGAATVAESADAAEDEAPAQEVTPAEAARRARQAMRGGILDEWRERSGAAWMVHVHMAFLLGLALFPVARIAYERLANAPLKPLVSWGGLGLALVSILVGWILVELLVQGLNLVNIVDIAGRELLLYYVSPIAYVLGTAFLFIIGLVFYFNYAQMVQSGPFGGQAPSLQDTFSFMGTVLLFILPLWTMRLLAEEQRQGTIELLLTSPVRDVEVVLGKYIAAVSLFMDVLAFTLLYTVILFSLGNPDPGPVLSGYLGVLLFGSALLAVGVFTSSLTENQVVAAVLSFAVYLGFLLVSFLPQFGVTLPVKELNDLLGSVNIFNHLDSFLRGLVNSYSVVFFLSVTAVSLFLATRVLEMRRWR